MTTAAETETAGYDAEFDVNKLYVWGVSLLIGFIGYSSQIFVFWGYLGGAGARGFVVLGVFNVLLHLLYYNYYLAVTVEPGHVPLGWEPPRDGANVYELKRDTLKPRYCRICKGFKPPRTHHCADCDRCVLKMDHHCPWIGSCVGFWNQGHFLRFVYMVDVTCGFAMVLHGMRMYELVVDSLNGTYYVRQPTQTEVAFLIINMTLLFFVLVLVGALSCYHAYLVSRNTTTIESREKDRVAKLVRSKRCRPTPYPYDLGVVRNFKALFGDSVLLWWLPKRMVGNGLDFSIRDGLTPPVYWPPPGYTREVGDPTKVAQRCDPSAAQAIYEDERAGACVVAEIDDDGETVIRQYSSNADPAALECGGEDHDYRRSSSRGLLSSLLDSGKEDKSEAGEGNWDDDDDSDSDDDFAGMHVPLTTPAVASGAELNRRAAEGILQRRSVFSAHRHPSGYDAKLADYTRVADIADPADADDETPLVHIMGRQRPQMTR